jgi:formylglycine-generating enzyme required for sulfatase activity
VPLDIGFQLSAEAFLYLKPKLSALVYSLAGISADYRRGPALEAEWKICDPQCKITLYDKWSVNVGMSMVGVDDNELPNLTLLQKKRTIETWYCPEIQEQAPVFTKHPSDVIAAVFTEVLLEAGANGCPEPEYQWFHNGQAIPLANQSSLAFRQTAQSVGAYRVTAQNRLGRVYSNIATVSLTTPPPPPGMVLIPAGSFWMGDSFNDGLSEERPVHSVYVSAFYMDKYEVTKAFWDEVANWAVTNGYDISSLSGSGKAANHPVQSVSWYDCVKWCNARSEKDGLMPCYKVSCNVYRTGDSVPDCNWSARGYRLPTEAEWEKAARGPVCGQRFPFGNTISHSQANYYSDVGLDYDVSPTRGFHPTFVTGDYPYTSPVGYFAANRYGLYDMAGNVCEWCWDWYSIGYYSSSSGTDPRGPSSGSFRQLRGGSWGSYANHPRVADRYGNSPDTESLTFGFRCVRGL